MKKFITDLDEIEQLLRDDPAFTEAVNRDKKGVYLVDGDGTKRYITKLEMAPGPAPEHEHTDLTPRKDK